jgi:hypothetical protein
VRRILLSLAAAALLAAPAAAHAEGLFADYQSLCVGVGGNPDAALGAADAGGWMVMPDTLIKAVSSSGQFKDIRGRLRTTKLAMEMLIVGRMDETISGVPMQLKMCAVASTPADAQLKGQVASWAAVAQASQLTKDGRVGYFFLDEGGKHLPINPDDAANLKLLRDGRVHVVAVQDDKQMSMAVFAIPTTNESR